MKGKNLTPLTDSQKTRIYEMLDEGLDSDTIVRRFRSRISKQQVAACRAHWTMTNRTQVFEVQGTYVVSAPNREDAEAVVSPKRIGGTRVLSSEVKASRLPKAEAENFLA